MIDKKRASEVIDFLQLLNLTDDFYGQPFILQDWQREVLRDVYGTVKDDGYRQYKYAYLEIPKKNGKTTMIAGLGVYHLVCDGPEGQIFCCAADRGQATLVYKAAVSMIEQSTFLSKILKVTDSRKEIKNIKTGTILKVLSAEAYSKHGINPTVVIFDELHAQRNRELWDVMTYGTSVTRKEPLWWVITTAGDDPDRNSIGYEIHEKALKINKGELVEPNWYVKIFGIDTEYEGDIFDEELWYKVNPSLGVSIPIEAIREEAISARNSPSQEKLFRWLRLNQWISTKQTGWLELTLWDKTVGKWNMSELLGKKCYAGLDLSSTTDLTGLVLLFPQQEGLEEWRFISEAWIPEDNMKERIKRDHVPYDRWVNEKYLHATAGNVIDYDFVKARIEQMSKQYSLKFLCTDPWNSRMLTQQLEKQDITCIEVQQNMANMSPAMKEIERLMKIGQMTHEKNPLARWCFGNVVVVSDGNGNIKPMKNKARERIDVTVALINAMSIAITQENMAPKVPYNEDRGIILL